jgi:hypothetical protein
LIEGAWIGLIEGVLEVGPEPLNEGAEAALAVRRKPRWLEYGRSICLEETERWTLYAESLCFALCALHLQHDATYNSV